MTPSEEISIDEAVERYLDNITDDAATDAIQPHLSFSTNGFTSITFNDSNTDASFPETIEFSFQRDGNPWETYRGPNLWAVPFAGDYKVNFTCGPLLPTFGSNDSLFAREFTEIQFHDNFDISGITDMSNMFSQCTSLRSIDLGNMNVAATQVNLPAHFGPSAWSPVTEYHMGDITISDNEAYIAVCQTTNTVPALSSNWLLLGEEGSMVPEPKLSQEVKENTAGISSGDIPE